MQVYRSPRVVLITFMLKCILLACFEIANYRRKPCLLSPNTLLCIYLIPFPCMYDGGRRCYRHHFFCLCLHFASFLSCVAFALVRSPSFQLSPNSPSWVWAGFQSLQSDRIVNSCHETWRSFVLYKAWPTTSQASCPLTSALSLEKII